jgi:tetratricopeptide (TPR) repeat protein
MARDEDQVEDLSRQSDLDGEKAAQRLLEGLPEQALAHADRAVHSHEKLWRSLDGDRRFQKASFVYAARLQDRAEIRRALCVALTDARRLMRICRPAIDDCTRAIDMIRASGRPARGELPLWIPGVLLMRAEFYSWMGDAAEARADADEAIARYRELQDPADEPDGPSLANALTRQADLLWRIGARQDSIAVHREAVETYRPHAVRGGQLWARRHRTGLDWATTPTFERFCRTASLLAERCAPARPSVARDALLALQDAAEGYADLVPLRDFPRHAGSEAMARFTASVWTIQQWLVACDEQHLANRYGQWLRASKPRSAQDDRWADPIRRLRPDVEVAAGRYLPVPGPGGRPSWQRGEPRRGEANRP